MSSAIAFTRTEETKTEGKLSLIAGGAAFEIPDICSGGTTAFTYDFESRVTSITKPGMTTNAFSYNGLDTRVGVSDSLGSRSFKRNGIGVTAPVLSDGLANYTPSGEVRGGVKTIFHSALKSSDIQTGSSAAVSASVQFDAFGNPISGSGSWKSPFAYAGQFGYQQAVDTGLKLLGHRYYDSDTGRFLTRDPIMDGRNWYGYCSNGPAFNFDNDGNQYRNIFAEYEARFGNPILGAAKTMDEHMFGEKKTDREGFPVRVGGILPSLINPPNNAMTLPPGVIHLRGWKEWSSYQADNERSQWWRDHEHKHVDQIRQDPMFVTNILVQYLLTLSHDNAPYEVEADKYADHLREHPEERSRYEKF